MDRPDLFPARVEIDVDPGGALATMRFSGTIRADDLQLAHRLLGERLDGRTVTGLILDARASTPDYTADNLVEAVEASLEVASPHRCALVTAHAREDTLKVIETAGVPFAVRVRGFLDLEAGRDWVAGC